MSKAVVFFAEGTEECEALLVVDLLRRAKVDVTVHWPKKWTIPTWIWWCCPAASPARRIWPPTRP